MLSVVVGRGGGTTTTTGTTTGTATATGTATTNSTIIYPSTTTTTTGADADTTARRDSSSAGRCADGRAVEAIRNKISSLHMEKQLLEGRGSATSILSKASYESVFYSAKKD